MGVLVVVGTGWFRFGGGKNSAAAELDEEEEISKEEGTPPRKNDGPGMRAGVQSSNLTYYRNRV